MSPEPFKCLWEKKNGPGAGRCATQCATCAQLADEAEQSHDIHRFLAEHADVVIPGLERAGALSTAETLALRDWFTRRA